MKNKFISFLILLFCVLKSAAQVLPVPEIIQEKDQWCWAGVSKCVLDYYGVYKAQCEIAEYTRTTATWHNYGSVNCCTNPNVGCNYSNYNWGKSGSIEDILEHFAAISTIGTDALNVYEITNNISDNKPFIVRWAWLDNSGGHFVVGHGISGNNVYYMDPWFGEGMHISSYDNLVNDGVHKWTHTNVFTTSPTAIENNIKDNDLFSVYPNPVSKYLKINLIHKDNYNIEIYNELGQKVYNTSFFENSIQLNIEDWTAGIYNIIIITETGEKHSATISKI